MTDVIKISFSCLSLDEINSYDKLKDHLNISSQGQESHPDGHTKNQQSS